MASCLLAGYSRCKSSREIAKLVLANTKKAGDEGWLSEDVKKALLEEMDVVAKEITQSTDDKIEDLEFEIESLKESIGK